MAKELKPRSEMDPKYTWKLSDIFPDDEAFEQELRSLEEALPAVSAFRGKVAQDPKAVIRADFDLRRRLSILYSYAFMKQDQDGADTHAQDMAGRAMSFIVRCRAEGSFLEPELLAMPEEELKALRDAEDFSDYSVYLSELLRMKPHTLSAAEEKLMAAAGEVLQAPGEIFDMFDDVDVPFPKVVNEAGEEEELSHAGYGVLIRSRDRDVRRRAYEAMMGTFGKFASTVTAMYDGNVKADLFRMRARGYASCREMELFANQIPEKVYDNLIAAVTAALPDLNRALEVRRKRLGVEELYPYDLYAPIFDQAEMKMPYEQACDTVLKALAPLGESYCGLLKKAFSEGWIDVYPNKNKRSGAYSSDAWGVHPYVLLNHTDDLESCFTIAHELGHAMHTWHSEHSQPFPKADYSLFVAEVASTTNEVLLMHYLMDRYAGQPQILAMLCNQFVEAFRTTVFRQTLFAEFEWKAHRMAEQGQSLTKDSLKQVHEDLNRKYYGAVCRMDDLIGWEWMRIPHFYRSFYVYVYATGYCAAVAIADRILHQGAPAVEGYLKFLSAGCSVPPIEALRYAGVDMEDESSVRGSLQVFARMTRQLEEFAR